MLRKVKKILGYGVLAKDGDEVGEVQDFLFDDESWTVRYMVVDTGEWLPGRQVLLSPESFGSLDADNKKMHVELTRKSIEESPGVEQDQPVSRQKEAELSEYFGWSPYWGSLSAAPVVYLPQAANQEKRSEAEKEAQKGDPNLRSAKEVEGYRIDANDGEIGHVEDFVLEDTDWGIRYLIVDTRNWWPGKKVLVAPVWAEDIHWSDARVKVNLVRDTIKQAPEFDPDEDITKEYETALQEHYGWALDL
ncbi:MAG: PRC-barrel domain-containing protein [Phycisphaerae bacterium]